MISNEVILNAYKKMLFLRRFEERIGQLYAVREIQGFCHLYIGQEAIAVGIKAAIADRDQIITSYRDHGFMLACNSDPMSVIGELLGRVDGCSHGKGGSMHMFDVKNDFYGGHGIVGAQVSLGTGIAFANNYLNKKSVCITCFGDGAFNQGQVFESFNMASLWKLPIVYVVENNGYAMGTKVNDCSANSNELYKRAEPFDIPSIQADGMDFFAVYNAMNYAVEYARKNGPYLIEFDTYRYKGHSVSDPATYRTTSEVLDIKDTRDPIKMLYNHILESKISDDEYLKQLKKKINLDIEKYIENAKKSQFPTESDLLKDVYMDLT